MAGAILSVLFLSWMLVYAMSGYIFMKKAGYPGWYAFIPGFNLYILTQIADRSGWWALAFFVPILNLAASLLIWTEVGEKFGKDSAFSVGSAWMNTLFLPILALGDAELQREHLPSDLNPNPETYRTFRNEQGDWVEEVPLDDWD